MEREMEIAMEMEMEVESMCASLWSDSFCPYNIVLDPI